MKLLVVSLAVVLPLAWGWWLARRDERRRLPELLVLITVDISRAATALREVGAALERLIAVTPPNTLVDEITRAHAAHTARYRDQAAPPRRERVPITIEPWEA